MRAALGLLALFAAAVGLALFASQSSATVTVYWPPWRIDLSLNLLLLAMTAFFVLLYWAVRALSGLAALPEQAKAWRDQQRERNMNTALREAMALILAGRFSRAKKLALNAAQHALALSASNPKEAQACAQVRVLALLTAAQASFQLQDEAGRSRLYEEALQVPLPASSEHFEECVRLLSARSLLELRQANEALNQLALLPLGTQRRTLALRIKLRALRDLRQTQQALEPARLLVKHGGFTELAGSSIVRNLCIGSLDQCHDIDQLIRCYEALQDKERLDPTVCTYAALRLQQLMKLEQDDRYEWQEKARSWLQPLWRNYLQLKEPDQLQLVRSLCESFLSEREASVPAYWLAEIEGMQRKMPQDALLQYLAGRVFMQRQLWGKAQQLLSDCAAKLADVQMRRKSWQCLAILAEQRGDTDGERVAWKQAALCG